MSQPTTSRSPRVYDAIADALHAAEVECMFGVLGEDTAPVVVAASARGITYYPARHENQAVSMAIGYARATGRVGVATVTGGPGFTNALTAINTAHRAGARVAVLTGAGSAAEDDHSPDTVRRSSPVSWLKYFPQAAVLDLLGIPVLRPQTPEAVATDTARTLERARRGTAVIVLGRGLVLKHASSTGTPRTEATREAIAPPESESIGALADLLQETWAVQRPMILAGQGAVAAGAAPALRELASCIGALLATTLPARGLFRGDPFDIGVCGTYSTPVASELITQADCVIAFGASLNPWTTYSNTLFPKTRLIQVNTDTAALERFLPADLTIACDARLVAQALVAELTRRGHRYEGFRSDAVRTSIASWRKDHDVVDRSTPERIDPRTLMLELDRMLPSGRILCIDGGQHARFAVTYMDTERPQNFIRTGDAGSIALSFGAANGAAIGRRGELVVLACGDGGTMMALGDVETAVRLRLPILIVISNDESYGAEVNVLANLGLDTRLADTPCPSFEDMAKAMGARAATVRKVADLAVVESWLRERPSLPLVLNCRVNPEVRAG